MNFSNGPRITLTYEETNSMEKKPSWKQSLS